MSSIEQLDQKLTSHIENQNQKDERITKAIEKLTDTVSQIHVFEVSLANVREDITDQKQIIQVMSDRLNNVEKQTEMNSELRKDFKHIKNALIGAIIVAAVGVAVSYVWPSKNVVELSPKAIEQIKKG
jgi:chromosome segregation ATPase